ncbi:MAG: VWA domain-containing protein [Blastocatellia bacterium]
MLRIRAHFIIPRAIVLTLTAVMAMSGISPRPAPAQTNPPGQNPGRQPPAQNDQQKEPRKDTDQEPVTRVETQIVQLDMVVTDKAGKLVGDLRQEDFQLFEDGKPQEISYFSVGTSTRQARWIAPAAKTSGPAKPGEKAPAVEVPTGRHIVLAIDDLHLAPANLVYARQALLKFIEQQIGAEDQAALITTSGQLGMFQQFTTDRAALQRAINRLSVQERKVGGNFEVPRILPYQAELIDRNDTDALTVAVNELVAKMNIPRDMAVREVQGRARQIIAENTNITRGTLGTLENIVRELRELNGRKVMVLVSDGFLLGLGTGSGAEDQLRRITDAATRSGVVIYSIDARGLFAVVPGGDASQPGYFDPTGVADRIERASYEAQRDGLNALAADTGGFAVFNNNDLNIGFKRILDDNEVYYLIAYEPVSQWRDGRFHKIELKIKSRPELKVRTRKGYLAPDAKAERKAVEKEEKEAEKQKTKAPEQIEKDRKAANVAQVNKAIGSLYPLRGIPVEMSADYLEWPGAGGIATVSAQIDPSGINFVESNGRWKAALEITVICFDEKGKPAGDVVDRLDLSLKPETLNLVQQRGIRYNKSFPLKPGYYNVRLGIREDGGKKLGSAGQWVEVPDLAKKTLTLSSIFLNSVLVSAASIDQTMKANQEEANRQQQNTQLTVASRRFRRNSALDFSVLAYNPRADAQGNTDLVIQPQVFSGSKVVLATPLKKIEGAPGEKGKAEVKLEKGMGPPAMYAARLTLEDFPPGSYELRVVVIDRVAKVSAKRSISFVVE